MSSDADALRRRQVADLVRRLETSEAHNEALVADLRDREAADSQTHTSLASHVAELTVAEADVAELQCGRKDWDRERRDMSEEIYTLRCEKMMHRSELKEVRRAERRKLVAELVQRGNPNQASARTHGDAGRCQRCDGLQTQIEHLLRENQRLRSGLGGPTGDGTLPHRVRVGSPRTPPSAKKRLDPLLSPRTTSFASFRSG